MTQGWVTIDLNGPLDLAASLESGQAFRWRRVEAEGGECFEGVVFDNLVRLRQSGRALELDSFPDLPFELRPLVEDYLCLGHDLEAIYEELGTDSRVANAIAAYPGLRIQRQDPWECLTSFICSANNNITRISQNVESIADAFGDPIAGSQRRTFPAPAVVADAGEAALRELGLGFRAKYLTPAARQVAEGAIDLYALREMEYAEASLTMTELAGVGDKVANCVLLFSLDKPEAFPVDVWIDRALREWYFEDGVGKSLPRTRMREWAQARFGKYAGYANQYLFHSRRLQGSRKAANS